MRALPRFRPPCQHRHTRPAGLDHTACVQCGARFALVMRDTPLRQVPPFKFVPL